MRIHPADNVQEGLVKMAEGNPGAATCMVAMLQKNDWKTLDGMTNIVMLDQMGLYGSELYMLWNDCCGQDLNELENVILNWHVGNLSTEDIQKNLSQGRGTPFEGLKRL